MRHSIHYSYMIGEYLKAKHQLPISDTEVLIHFEEAAEQSIRLIKSEKLTRKW